MRTVAIIFLFGIPSFASAAIFINEIKISPTNERFIELYNSDNIEVDLTGWYIQRKTASLDAKFGSLVTSTQLNGKIIKPHSYLLISRSQLNNPDIVAGDLTLTESNTIRIRDSKGKDVDQAGWGSIDAGKSYQRTSSGEWIVGMTTPGAVNAGTTNVPAQNSNVSVNQSASVSQLSVQPQITAQAGPQMRVVLAGAPIIFEGKIAGLENSNGTTKTTWSFGDGASAEGESVSHTYYYPGEYTAILDVVSGGLKATDKMLVRVVLPNLSLSTGGDASRSFITIQNLGGDELEVSGWQVVASDNKTFTFPKNTILGARRSATFASEVTGLATPSGITTELLFPNGSRVDTKGESVAFQAVVPKAVEKPKVVVNTEARTVPQATQVPQNQKASAMNAVTDALTSPQQQEGSLWPWYVGSAFLGVLALLGLRLTRDKQQNGPDEKGPTAEDFEIIEETNDEEPH